MLSDSFLSRSYRCSAVLAVLLVFMTGARAQEPELPLPVAPLTAAEREAAAAVELPALPAFQNAAPTAPAASPELPSPVLSDGRIQATPLVTEAAAGTRSSTSATGQFIVHGPDLRTRSALADRCEQIAAELDRLVRSPGNWVVPMVVLIKPQDPGAPADAPITPQVSQLGQGYHLQLTVPQRNGLKPEDLKRELVRLLMVERMLRQQTQVTTERSDLLPDWILTGTLEAMNYRHRARPSAIFAAVLKSGKIYSIEEIIGSTPRPLDALSRALYETSCCALVLALLDQPEGPLRFSRFLASLTTDAKPEAELLRQWFPALASSDSSLNKWWSLQLASLASPSLAETMDPYETAQQLDAALTLTLPIKADETWPEPTVVAAIAQTDVEPEPPAPVDVAEKKPVPPAATPKPKPTPKSTPKEAAVSTDEAPGDDESEAMDEAAEDENKPGFLRRVFSFGRSKDGEGSEEEMTAEPDVEAEKPADPPPAPPKKEEPPPPKKEEPKKEEPKKEAKEEPAIEEEADDEKKRSLNPLKWFRRGKDEKEAESEKEASLFESEWSERLAAADPLIWGTARRLLAVNSAPKRQFVQQAAPALRTISYPIEDYALILKHPEAKEALQRSLDQISAIGSRGNVVFREVLKGYAKVLGRLIAGETKGVDADLKALRAEAQATLNLGRAVRDHLDWYEASQSTEYTGVFEDFLRLPERIQEELPARDDPMSIYLDAVEAAFSE